MRRLLPALTVLALLTAGLPVLGVQEEAPRTLETDQPVDPLEEARIVRDEFGIAHVFADSERALWYGNGYVQAQDRLWAMDLLRHLSYGEGASVVGPGGGILEMDLNTRRNLYNETQLEAQIEDAPDRFKDIVEWYTEGVNRAADEMHATGEIPAEFPALQHAWHDWEPLDTVAVATFLLAEFGNGGGAEIDNAQLLAQLEDRLGELDPSLAPEGPMAELSSAAPVFEDADGSGGYSLADPVLLDVDGDGLISTSDVRLIGSDFGEKVEHDADDVGTTLNALNKELRFLDQNGDGVFGTEEPIYLSDGLNVAVGDVRLAEAPVGDEGTKVESTDADFDAPLTAFPDPSGYAFSDSDQDGIDDRDEVVLADTDDDGSISVGDLRLSGPLAGHVIEETQTSNPAMDAFTDLNWGHHADAYPTIQSGTYDLSPQADAMEWDEIPHEQRTATRAAMDAETFGLDVEDAGAYEEGFYEGEEIDLRLGSNALLVAPSLSETGNALVGGGPQMGYFNPQVPYEIGLHSEENDIEAEGIGVTGAPGVIIGRTANFAWTVTSGISDQTDVVALPAAQDGNRSYVWDGQTKELDCRTEEHELFTPPATGGPAFDVVEQEVCLSEVGPIIATTTDSQGDAEWFFARQISSRFQEIPSAVKWLSLDRADDFEDFASRFEPGSVMPGSDGFAFTFNFHYAGVDENGDQVACYKHVGRQPIRDTQLDPRLPTPAGDRWDWRGFISGDGLPWECNPDEGYFAQWNNLPQEGWSAGDSRELWGSVHRVERLDLELQQVIEEKAEDLGIPEDQVRLGLDDVKAILERAATEDSLAHGIVPHIQNGGRGTAPAANEALADWALADYPWRSGEEGQDPGQGTVSNESGEVYTDPGHTVYDEMVTTLLDRVFADELDENTRVPNLDPRNSSDPHAGDHGRHNNPFAVLVDALRGESTHDWCDDIRTAVVESCEDQIAFAFAATGLDRADTPDDIERTDQHRSPFTSLGLGPSYSMPMTNRATYYHFHEGSNTASSASLLPAGVTGHVNAAHAALILSGQSDGPEHMHDQLERYVDFELRDVPWTAQEAAENGDSDRKLLLPPPLQ